MSKVCAIQLCPFLREKNSYVCKAHGKSIAADKALVPTKRYRVRGKTTGGLTFADQCRLGALPAPVAEFKFHPTRKYRADWAFINARLLVEVEGGAFLKDGGRHNRGAGFRNDLEKYAEAAILGYRVIRVLPEWIEDGRALTYVERALTTSNK